MSFKINSLDYKCIQNGIGLEEVEWAELFGKHLARTDLDKDLIEEKYGKKIYRLNLSTSQLRKFFGELRRIEAECFGHSEENSSKKGFKRDNIIGLIPKLAYSVGKEKNPNPKIKDFYIEVKNAILKVNSFDDFQRFVKLIEAVVAFHKLYEVKN